jgi:SAM-dependent methyltransferase
MELLGGCMQEKSGPVVGPAQPRALDIGCGKNKVPGAIGMDINPRTDADVIHDLNSIPYPFPADEFDVVWARHVIEHVREPLALMMELHRITRPGGIIKLVTPHWTNPDWATDLTHRNHFNSYSFRDLIVGQEGFPFYADVRFRQLRAYVTVANLWKMMGVECLVNLDHRHRGLRFVRKFWEFYLSSVMRGKDIYFDLEVVK